MSKLDEKIEKRIDELMEYIEELRLADLKSKAVIEKLKADLTGGYFYEDNCRVNFSEDHGWYIKRYINSKIKTESISEDIANKLVRNSFMN